MILPDYDLQPFIDAQDHVFEQVLSELRDGHKQSHWMWFIFPQIEGLGRSAMAARFAISGRQEAETFLDHPILGPRLRECTRLVNLVQDRSIEQIFGYPDNLKFHSSMTLFAHAGGDREIFRDAINKYFSGKFDSATLARFR